MRAHFLILACLPAMIAANAQPSDVLEDLAKQRANPLSGIRQVTLSEQPNVGLPAGDGPQNLTQLLVTWPIPLGPRWNVVTYTIVSGISQPDAAGDGRVGGLGDTMLTAAVTPSGTGAPSGASVR